MKSALLPANALVYVLFVLLPASVHAETNFGESIEWVVADSDRVVVGKIVKVDRAIGPDKQEYEAATVAISSILKGAADDRVTFLLRNYAGPCARQWLDEGIPILFFLVKNDGVSLPFPAEKFAWVLRDDHNCHSVVLLDKSQHHGSRCDHVLTRDFEVLTEVEAILACVIQAVKLQVKDRPPHSHTLDVPYDTEVFKKLYAGSSVKLKVPIDEKLEILGRRWCKSANPRERAEGAAVLRHFKNETNIEILKSLLADPNMAESTKHRSVSGESEMKLVYRKKLYYVRQAAFAVLQEFGANVDKPVLEILLEGKDDK